MTSAVTAPEPPFETSSYVGSDLAQFFRENERPPRSAKFVAAIDYDGYSFAKYWLSTIKDRSGWVLRATSEDGDFGRMYALMAWGEPYRGIPAKRAAEELLRQVWLDQISLYEYRGPSMAVDAEGLLTKADIRRIEASLPRAPSVSR